MTRNSWRSAAHERPANASASHAKGAEWRSGARGRHDDGTSPDAGTSTSCATGGWRGTAGSKRSCAHDTKRHSEHHPAPPKHNAPRPPRPGQRKPRGVGAIPAQQAAGACHASPAGTASDTASVYSSYSSYTASFGGSSTISGGGSTNWADMADEDDAISQAGFGIDLRELEAEHSWFKEMMAEHKAEVEAAAQAAPTAPQQQSSRRGKAAKKAARKAAEPTADAAPPAGSSRRCASSTPVAAAAGGSTCSGDDMAAQRQRGAVAAPARRGRLSPVISSDCDCSLAEAVGSAAQQASLHSSDSGGSWTSDDEKAVDRDALEALEAGLRSVPSADVSTAAVVVKAAVAAKAATLAAARAVAEAWQKHVVDVAATAAAAAAAVVTSSGSSSGCGSGSGSGFAGRTASPVASAASAAAQVMVAVELEAKSCCGVRGPAGTAVVYERLCLSAANGCGNALCCGRVA